MNSDASLRIEFSFIEVNGVKLHMAEKGKGPVVLLLHGWPEFWYSWREAFRILPDGFRIIAPDLRGYNKSEKPRKLSDYALAKLVDDVLGIIDYTAEQKVHLVGHDWGGVIAWQVAIQHPERLKDLVILNCPHPEAFRQALKKDWSQRRKSWYMGFFLVPFLPEFLFSLNYPMFFKRILRDWTTSVRL